MNNMPKWSKTIKNMAFLAMFPIFLVKTLDKIDTKWGTGDHPMPHFAAIWTQIPLDKILRGSKWVARLHKAHHIMHTCVYYAFYGVSFSGDFVALGSMPCALHSWRSLCISRMHAASSMFLLSILSMRDRISLLPPASFMSMHALVTEQ